MVSSRFAAALCVLLALTLIPTIIHSYLGIVSDDGQRASTAGKLEFAGFINTASGRNPTWGQRRFASDDWVERRFTSADDELFLTVVRSYNLTALYHHPELAIADEWAFRPAVVQHLAAFPSIPVFVLRSPDGAVGLYVLQYRDEFVEDPIRFQLRTAGELLYKPRTAMTLFFARERETNQTTKIDDLTVTHLLASAMRAFLAPRMTFAIQ